MKRDHLYSLENNQHLIYLAQTKLEQAIQLKEIKKSVKLKLVV